MKTDATSVDSYLEVLPPSRRAAVATVCERLRASTELVETFQHGMPFFTLGGEQFIAVASQKQYVSVYVAGLDETLPAAAGAHDARQEHADLGAELAGINRGKSCLRFRDTQLERLTSEVVDSLVEVTRGWWAAQR